MGLFWSQSHRRQKEVFPTKCMNYMPHFSPRRILGHSSWSAHEPSGTGCEIQSCLGQASISGTHQPCESDGSQPTSPTALATVGTPCRGPSPPSPTAKPSSTLFPSRCWWLTLAPPIRYKPLPSLCVRCVMHGWPGCLYLVVFVPAVVLLPRVTILACRTDVQRCVILLCKSRRHHFDEIFVGTKRTCKSVLPCNVLQIPPAAYTQCVSTSWF